MPAYKITHPEFAKPRMVEAPAPRSARSHVAKELTVSLLTPRQIYDLTEQGVDLEQAGKRNGNG